MNNGKQSKESTTESRSGSPIIYFDATIRRKEKMKLASQRGTSATKEVRPAEASTLLESPTPIPIPAPRVEDSEASDSLNKPIELKSVELPPSPASIQDDAEMATVILAPESPTVTTTALTIVQPSPALILRPERLETKQLANFAINFIVEHTGYPPDMIDLSADLEADLGIDSITLAQLLGEIRDYCGVTPVGDFTLDSFKTLDSVIRIFQEGAAKQQRLGTEVVA